MSGVTMVGCIPTDPRRMDKFWGNDRLMRLLIGIVALVCGMACALPAHADQADGTVPRDIDNAFEGDYLIVGAGVGYTPDYSGSDDYMLRPIGGFRASISNIRIFSSGVGVGADLIPDAKAARVKFALGPVLRYRANRTGKVRDDVVRRLPRLKETWEAGIVGGVSLDDILHGRDSLSLGMDVRWSFAGNKGARIISTDISYFTPVSRAAGIGVSLGMDHVNRDYADYHYSVTAQASAASGLPAYQASGGWKNRTARLYGGYDLDGNLRNGGWGIGGIISYERLRGAAAHTPITALRGSREQWFAGIGLGYTF